MRTFLPPPLLLLLQSTAHGFVPCNPHSIARWSPPVAPCAIMRSPPVMLCDKELSQPLSSARTAGDFMLARTRQKKAVRTAASTMLLALSFKLFGATTTGLISALAASVPIFRRAAQRRQEAELSSWTLTTAEALAVQEAANEEAVLMSAAPWTPLPVTMAVTQSRDLPEDAVAAMRAEGVVRLTGGLQGDAASALAAHINATLASRAEAVKRGEEDEAAYFGGVLCRERRYDLKLDLDAPEVSAALACLVNGLQPTLHRLLGGDAELFELSALVSDPGAPVQLLHADTSYVIPTASGGDGGRGLPSGAPGLCTAFVALQDIDETMGATTFLPGTHTEEAHARFDDREGDGSPHELLLRSAPRALGLLSTGDVALFDSRLLHGGGANTSPRRRILFYFSAKATTACPPEGSLLPHLRGLPLASLAGA